MSNTTLLFVIPICFTMFFLTEINGIFGDLDKALNHSKKRKIKWQNSERADDVSVTG